MEFPFRFTSWVCVTCEELCGSGPDIEDKIITNCGCLFGWCEKGNEGEMVHWIPVTVLVSAIVE